jgi:hypothetical protein
MAQASAQDAGKRDTITLPISIDASKLQKDVGNCERQLELFLSFSASTEPIRKSKLT